MPAAAALLSAATVAHAQDCATDADCVAGYECAWVGEGNTSGGSVGGGPGPICSDGTCDAGETEESCPQDCSEDRTCQVAFQLCNEDEECAPGFYCDDESGGVTSFGSVTGSTTGGMTYDGTCALIGTTSGSDGGSATDGGAGAGSEETTGSDDVSSVNVGTVGTVTSSGGPGGGSGGGGDGGPSSGNGGPSGGGGHGHGNNNGNGSGHGSGHGPWQPWPGHPGCSVGGTGAPAGGLFLAALAGLGAVVARRRRN